MTSPVPSIHVKVWAGVSTRPLICSASMTMFVHRMFVLRRQGAPIRMFLVAHRAMGRVIGHVQQVSAPVRQPAKERSAALTAVEARAESARPFMFAWQMVHVCVFRAVTGKIAEPMVAAVHAETVGSIRSALRLEFVSASKIVPSAMNSAVSPVRSAITWHAVLHNAKTRSVARTVAEVNAELAT